jgi:hypothetical protein
VRPPQLAEEQRDEGARDKGAAALLRRAERAARAEQRAERLDTGWLDSFTQMGVAIYSSTNELLVPGRKIRRDPAEGADNGAAAMRTSEKTEPTSSREKEDPAAVAERDAALLMSERTEPEPTLRHPTHSRASRSSGPPEKQPWTFGGSYWPSRK